MLTTLYRQTLQNMTCLFEHVKPILFDVYHHIPPFTNTIPIKWQSNKLQEVVVEQWPGIMELVLNARHSCEVTGCM